MSAAPAVVGQSDPIAEERAAAQPEAALLKTYRNYTLGYQIDTRTQAQREMFEELNKNAFCINLCKLIVQTTANRLSIARFDLDGPETVVGSLEDFVARLTLLNDLPNLAAEVTIATLRDGDHAVSLKWSGDTVRLIGEPWWNGEQGIYVAYEDDGNPRYAVREWPDGTTVRRNVYYPDRIERFVSQQGGTWQAINLASDDASGGQPVRWVDAEGGPLGIPVVHFANRLLPRHGAGGTVAPSSLTPTTTTPPAGGTRSRYGVSELAGGIIGLQDQRNFSEWNRVAAETFTGAQMLWGSGLAERKDEQGKTIPYPVVPGGMITSSSPDARFGHFPAGSLKEILDSIRHINETVSILTRIPIYVFTGDPPSGEALQRAEVDFAEKVDKLGEVLGPRWGSLLHKATRVENAYAAPRPFIDEDVPIRTVFSPSQRINAFAVATQVVAIAGVFGDRQAARWLGMQPADIAEYRKELEEDRQASAAMLDQFVSQGDQTGQGDGEAA
jgi:hypothetical protein